MVTTSSLTYLWEQEHDEQRPATRTDPSGETPIAYFNNAAQARLSAEVQQAGLNAIQKSPWEHSRGLDQPVDPHSSSSSTSGSEDSAFVDDAHRIRQLFAQSIGDVEAGKSQEGANIAIMPSTAFAMTLAAHNLKKFCSSRFSRAKKGQSRCLSTPSSILSNRSTLNTSSSSSSSFSTCCNSGGIMVLQDQMGSAVYPWQALCTPKDDDASSSGASHQQQHRPDDEPRFHLHIVPYPNDHENWTSVILRHLEQFGHELVAACLPPLHWSDGSLVDLVPISTVCRSRSIWVMIDATQAVGVMPSQNWVPLCRPTLLAASVHKWLRGPSGACLVYVDPQVQNEWEPLDQHGRSRNVEPNWEAYSHGLPPTPCDVQPYYPTDYVRDARKFDGGGKPNAILLPMIRTALEQVAQLDTFVVQQQLQELMRPLLEWVDSTQGLLSIRKPHAHHLVGLRPRGMTPEQMLQTCSQLQSEFGIVLAVRCEAFRVSPYLDNTPEEIGRLIHALKLLLPIYASLDIAKTSQVTEPG